MLNIDSKGLKALFLPTVHDSVGLDNVLNLSRFVKDYKCVKLCKCMQAFSMRKSSVHPKAIVNISVLHIALPEFWCPSAAQK